MKVETCETLIVGAGLIGSSVAMHLADKGFQGIRVIDLDLEGTLSSSELNAGGVRATWIQPLNIELSKRTIDYFSTVADEVGYRACGYLWLHPASRIDAALQAKEVQRGKGWPVEAWDLSELKRRVPFIDKTDGIAGAVFAQRDGLINPNLAKVHFRKRAIQRGVQFDDRTRLHGVEFVKSGAAQLKVMTEKFEKVMSHETKLKIASSSLDAMGREQVEYRVQRIINCAGPWANLVAERIGYKSPSYPVRRQVCLFDCKGLDLTPYGMIVDTSGVYFHPEATNVLSGYAEHGEPKGIHFHYDGNSFFEEKIWPALYERSSYFESLKHLSGWAGLYEVSPDESAILGEVHYGGIQQGGASKRVYEAHSFSGHGVMQSYAAGLSLSELIVNGRFETIPECERLTGKRFEEGKSVSESLII